MAVLVLKVQVVSTKLAVSSELLSLSLLLVGVDGAGDVDEGGGIVGAAVAGAGVGGVGVVVVETRGRRGANDVGRAGSSMVEVDGVR